MRELAGYDPAQFQRVMRWRIGEALLAYERRLIDDAQHDYEFETLAWVIMAAQGAKAKRPQPPEILRG